MNIIYWDIFQMRPAPRSCQPNKNETFYLVLCSCCNDTRWLRRSDALHAEDAKMCQACHCRQIGCAGYRATAAKYGFDFFLRKLQAYLRANLTKPERLVQEWLEEWGIEYEAQALVRTQWHSYIADFRIGTLLVEVNGEYWHSKRERITRDARLDRDWQRENGSVLWLTDHEILSTPCDARQKLGDALLAYLIPEEPCPAITSLP